MISIVCVVGKEKGLLVSELKTDWPFEGYKGNNSQTEAKILRNVLKKGDAYVNSGDLFTMDKDYFVYFADRTGDTFRFVCFKNEKDLFSGIKTKQLIANDTKFVAAERNLLPSSIRVPAGGKGRMFPRWKSVVFCRSCRGFSTPMSTE